MKTHKRNRRLFIAASIASTALLSCPSLQAMAQEAATMSCDELWYARNKIYARNGYCFQTPRAWETFGPGCFPPYGKLHGWERDRVNELQMWERRNRC
jgi:hypothetical protein